MIKTNLDDAWENIPTMSTDRDESKLMKLSILKKTFEIDLLLSRCLSLEKQNEGYYNLIQVGTESVKLARDDVGRATTELQLRNNQVEALSKDKYELKEKIKELENKLNAKGGKRK